MDVELWQGWGEIFHYNSGALEIIVVSEHCWGLGLSLQHPLWQWLGVGLERQFGDPGTLPTQP